MVYIKISPVIWSFLVFFCLTLHPALALSTTYYVNGNTGENTNDGTLATPWKTISYAVSMAFDQDTIYISPASYVESINLRPIPKRELLLIGLGADDNLPVIQSADPNTHTIDATEFNGTLQGLAVTGATNANGINITGASLSARIIGCQSYGNTFGIHVTGTSTPMIRNNLIFNNRSCGIGNMADSSATIDGNRIYENGSFSYGLAGICARDQSYPVIQNNIIWENHTSGIYVRDTAHPTIVNNTLLNHREQNTTGTAVKVNQEMGIQSLVILNNIIARNDTGLLSQNGILCTGNDYNNLYQNSADLFGFTYGAEETSADPLLSSSFCLQSASPCIDSGTTTAGPDHDINGVTRPQGLGIDVGACEYLKSSTDKSGSITSILFLLL